MSKTAKISARVLPARLERYQQAADALRLDELSDYIRRACDDLADTVLAAKPVRSRTAPVRSGTAEVRPDPRKKR